MTLALMNLRLLRTKRFSFSLAIIEKVKSQGGRVVSGVQYVGTASIRDGVSRIDSDCVCKERVV